MAEITIFDVLISVASLFTFLANLVVVVALLTTAHFKDPNNIFIAGMASADAFFGFCMLLVYILAKKAHLLDLLYSYDESLFVTSLHIYSRTLPFYMILGFTLNRFFLVRFPIQYDHYVTSKRSLIVVISLWVLAVPLACVPYFLMNEEGRNNHDNTKIKLAPQNHTLLFLINFFSAAVLLPLNGYTLYLVRRYKQNIPRRRSSIGSIDGEPVAEKLDLKAEIYLVIIIATFLLCTLPFGIARFIAVYNDTQIPKDYFHVFGLLYLANSFFNPFIYAWGTNDLEKTINDIYCARLIRTKTNTPAPVLINVKALRRPTLTCSTRESHHNASPTSSTSQITVVRMNPQETTGLESLIESDDVV